MKNNIKEIAKAIETIEPIYKETKSGITHKYVYKYVGTSVLDASSVYAEYRTRFSIAKGIIEDDNFTGKYYTRNGYEYPKNAYIR